MSAINKAPSFKYNSGFTTTLDIGYPLDNVVCYPVERDGTEVAQAPSGTEDAWYVGADFYMECDVRWIPESNTTNPVASGYSVGTAWDAMLAWARQRGQIRYIPDKNTPATFLDGYLIEATPGLEMDGSLRYHLKFRAASSYATVRASV